MISGCRPFSPDSDPDNEGATALQFVLAQRDSCGQPHLLECYWAAVPLQIQADHCTVC